MVPGIHSPLYNNIFSKYKKAVVQSLLQFYHSLRNGQVTAPDGVLMPTLRLDQLVPMRVAVRSVYQRAIHLGQFIDHPPQPRYLEREINPGDPLHHRIFPRNSSLPLTSANRCSFQATGSQWSQARSILGPGSFMYPLQYQGNSSKGR